MRSPRVKWGDASKGGSRPEGGASPRHEPAFDAKSGRPLMERTGLGGGAMPPVDEVLRAELSVQRFEPESGGEIAVARMRAGNQSARMG